MTSSNIVRWGGLAAMIGGLFWVVWSLLGRVSFEAAGSPFADGLLLAALLTLAGLAGLHALQGSNYGRIGRAGFYTTAVGLLLQALAALLLLLLMGRDAWEVTLQWLVAPVGSLIVLVGLVLYGAATLQARVLARWCGVGLIVVPPLAFYMHSKIFYGSLALFGVLWVALGYVLWSRSSTPTEQPSRVR
jgi:hypothetical protein